MRERKIKCKTGINNRSRIVWMWMAGVSARDIALHNGFSLSTVYRWVRRWKKEGAVNTKTCYKENSAHIVSFNMNKYNLMSTPVPQPYNASLASSSPYTDSNFMSNLINNEYFGQCFGGQTKTGFIYK